MNNNEPHPENLIRQHLEMLGHNCFGITELRVFAPVPMVAYVSTEDIVVKLTEEVYDKVPGIYIGVQPRPAILFRRAPNRWVRATSFPKTNCSTDTDIRCIKNCFFDIDVVSSKRKKGYPASEKELKKSLLAADKLSRISSLEPISTICCSGNGHYVVSAIEPIKITDNTISEKFKIVCSELAKTITKKIDGVKIDPVYNLSRVMRLMGTINRKGKATRLRPHRKADIIRESANLQSVYLSQKIINLNINHSKGKKQIIGTRNCNLSKIESCEFIKWCRSFPTEVSEPLWFAMITNLAPLKGGDKLIHDISKLDPLRYTYRQTQNLIERVIEKQYQPTRCDSICQLGFQCPKYGLCNIKAPMYLTVKSNGF